MHSNKVPGYQNGYACNITQAQFPQLWKGLIGGWAPSAGRQGMRLDDISSNRKPGVLVNNTSNTWNSSGGRGGFALAYDGTNDYTNIVSNIYTNQGSVSMWFKPTGLSGGNDHALFFGNDDVTSSPNYFGMSINDDTGVIRLGTEVGGFHGVDSASGLTANGRWTNLIMTSNGATWNLYGDGKKTVLTPFAGVNDGMWFSDITSISHYVIGSFVRGTENIIPFAGLIGDVMLYDRALDLSEIRLLASGASPLDLGQ